MFVLILFDFCSSISSLIPAVFFLNYNVRSWPEVAVVTPVDIELLVRTVTEAWLLLATVAIDDDNVDDIADDAELFAVVLTANILPWFVRMYTPFGVLITRTFSPAGILFGPESVDVFVPGIMMSNKVTSQTVITGKKEVSHLDW